jgi:DNA modification methylase
MTTRIIVGDALTELAKLPAESVHCCVTSPPYYGLRDYGVAGQLGLEATPDEYVAAMVGVFREVCRVLRGDGTLWLNIGDSYASGGRKTRDPGQSKIHPAFEGDAYSEGLRPADPDGVKPKDLLGIPWMLAFALRADGWWLRQDIIWAKPNPMPESVTDRCTKAHEYLFLLSKSERYYFDAAAIAEKADIGLLRGRSGMDEVDGVAWHAPSIATRQAAGIDSRSAGDGSRNKRSVWTIATAPFPEAHFATFPPALVEPCILAGCPTGGIVLDPFLGAGTTALVADRLGRSAIGIELNPAYAEMAKRRIEDDSPLFADVAG